MPIAKSPNKKLAITHNFIRGPERVISIARTVPGHNAAAASPNAKPGDSGRARYMSHSVTGMVRLMANCPRIDGIIYDERNGISTHEGMIDSNAVFIGPSLSQINPPHIFPATTNTVIRTVSSAPCFHENSTMDPPIALTATAAGNRTVENSISPLSLC